MQASATMDAHSSAESRSARMTMSFPDRRLSSTGPTLPVRSLLLALALIALVTGTSARAQLSISTAVDLAWRNNPRVKSAEADVNRAQAQLAQAHDVYIPSITAGADLGQAYGYLPYPPTLATLTAGSLVYSASQIFYVRSARAGLEAARYSLMDARAAVAEDTALAFIALDYDQQRAQVIHQQVTYADALVGIVQKRLDAGQDSPIDLTQAKLTAAQIRLAALKAEDDAAYDRDHLALLIGLPSAAVHTDSVFPDTPIPQETPAATGPRGNASSAVASLFATAEARRQQALGDARYRFWPQINLFAQYDRYATFTNSFKDLENIYKGNNGQTLLTSNEAAFGVQISLPFFDRARDARARTSAAEATKARYDAQNSRIEALDGQSKTRHSIDELKAQGEVAALQQQLAQQQLDILHLQLQSGTGNPTGQQMTPKDEQKARIDERDKYLSVVDAGYQLHQAEIQLLRQMGQLESWLKLTGASAPSPAKSKPPAASAPQP